MPNSESTYGEAKIRELLAQYGAEADEIENFIQDLNETKEDLEDLREAKDDETEGAKDYEEIKDTNNDNTDDALLDNIKKDEEKHEDYLLNAETLKILQATDEGQDLIIRAPELAKDELEKAIKDYLQKNK